MKQLSQIIRCDHMTNDTFVMQHEIEDFFTLSQLIVDESQEAVVYMSGIAVGPFGPGPHTLTTSNIPVLRGLMNKIGGDTPFPCKVYFINKTVHTAMGWGVGDIEYLEQSLESPLPIKIGAGGSYDVRVGDARRLIIEFLGTEKIMRADDMQEKFLRIFTPRIKQYLAQVMTAGGVSIFETDSRMADISDALQGVLLPIFDAYGFSLRGFRLDRIIKPGDANYTRMKAMYAAEAFNLREERLRRAQEKLRADTRAEIALIEAQARAKSREMEGYTRQQEWAYEVAKSFASNQNVGIYANMGAGLGMMGGMALGTGRALTSIIDSAMQPLSGGTPPAPFDTPRPQPFALKETPAPSLEKTPAPPLAKTPAPQLGETPPLLDMSPSSAALGQPPASDASQARCASSAPSASAAPSASLEERLNLMEKNIAEMSDMFKTLMRTLGGSHDEK